MLYIHAFVIIRNRQIYIQSPFPSEKTLFVGLTSTGEATVNAMEFDALGKSTLSATRNEILVRII